jgi:hypothetical protein
LIQRNVQSSLLDILIRKFLLHTRTLHFLARLNYESDDPSETDTSNAIGVPVVEEETEMQMEQVEEFSFSSDDEDDDVQEPPAVAVPAAIEYASYPPSNFFPTGIRHDDTNRVIENATNAESSLQRSMREGELLLESSSENYF